MLFDEWVRWRLSPWHHIEGWWNQRTDDDVLLVHYADLLADLDGEMARIASFLGIEIDERLWPDVVGRCRFDDYKASFAAHGGMDRVFEGGADAFFSSGGNRDGEAEMGPEIVERCAELAKTADVPDIARIWLEQGSLASGFRA